MIHNLCLFTQLEFQDHTIFFTRVIFEMQESFRQITEECRYLREREGNLLEMQLATLR